MKGIARLVHDPTVTVDEVQRSRGILRGLFGKSPVTPVGDVLVATVAATGAGLINASPASINRSFVVAGARYSNNLQQTVCLLTIPRPRARAFLCAGV